MQKREVGKEERLEEREGGIESGSGGRKGGRMREKGEWDTKFRQMLERYPLLSVCSSKCGYWWQWFIVNRKSREKMCVITSVQEIRANLKDWAGLSNPGASTL